MVGLPSQPYLLNEERAEGSVCSGKLNGSVREIVITLMWVLVVDCISIGIKEVRVSYLWGFLHLGIYFKISEFQMANLPSSTACSEVGGFREILPVLVCHLPAPGKYFFPPFCC